MARRQKGFVPGFVPEKAKNQGRGRPAMDYRRSVGDGPYFRNWNSTVGRRSGKMTAAVNEWLHETSAS